MKFLSKRKTLLTKNAKNYLKNILKLFNFLLDLWSNFLFLVVVLYIRFLN